MIKKLQKNNLKYERDTLNELTFGIADETFNQLSVHFEESEEEHFSSF